ncbi:RNase A-like domain-containing protein [Pantoea ananatis]|uniref:RNase A-like domain-containing protein n=1 Tax=Pantoea ananas TaxID=553 RepID=UPI001B309514|nr:RNase A-like domain-containing protein [Pantoea ananatis]
MDYEFQVAMSPVQLAAVLSDKSVTESEVMSNRLLGGLDLLMGSVELAGATSLCMVPEPTGLTKAACVVVGAHSLDSINAAADRIITGKDTRTATYQTAVALAKQFGADDKTAWNIGLTVDVGVPAAFGLAIGAARVVYVRAGTFKLIEHEAVTGVRAGGHTIAKHVAIPDSDLLARLSRSPQMSSVSSYYSVEIAEKAISSALKANRLKIIHWANWSNDSRPLELVYKSSTAVGYGFRQGSSARETCNAVRVVLLKKIFNGKPYYVLTSYPWMG